MGGIPEPVNEFNLGIGTGDDKPHLPLSLSDLCCGKSAAHSGTLGKSNQRDRFRRDGHGRLHFARSKINVQNLTGGVARQ